MPKQSGVRLTQLSGWNSLSGPRDILRDVKVISIGGAWFGRDRALSVVLVHSRDLSCAGNIGK